MSVIIHRNVTRLATFLDWTFDWTDAHCNKSFAEAGEVVFTAEVSEAAVAVEQSGGQMDRILSEDMLFTDAVDKRMQKRERVDVCLSTNLHREQGALCKENIKLRDTMRKNAFAALCGECISVADGSGKGIASWYGAVLCLAAAVEKEMGAGHVATLWLADMVCKAEVILCKKVLAIEETTSKEVEILHGDAWWILEEAARVAVYRRRLAEGLLVEAQSAKEAAVLCRRRLGLREFSNRTVQPLRRETLKLEEAFRRNWILRRDVHAGLRIAGTERKQYTAYKTVDLAMHGAFLRACRAVLSNIGVTTEEMTLEDFVDAVSQPPNYDRFSDFNVGDYEYAQALIRFVLISKAAQTEPVLYGLNVHVDIDDTNDRGIAEIKETTGATKVRFNKFYYHPPEVNVTLKGGNTADGWIVPCLIRTDGEDEYGRFFEVELRSSGQRVAGTISWTAKGY